ncbi:MAG: type IX secretion system membrane protein PorP/SprF [Alphaproteobacteria bacterium]|nr:type IX secretion system membrane protein PorP/SprF [Alphaproteobacteria bacterium]
MNFNPVRLFSAFFVVILLMSTERSVAQQDAQFSHYMFNGMYLNPGFAGVDGVTRVTGIARTQWLGYQVTQGDNAYGSPKAAVITVSTPLPFLNRKLGLGVHFLRDVKGPLAATEFQISGSYHIKIRDGKLGLGLRSGILSQSINGSYNVIDQNDPIYQALQEGRANQIKADLSAGAWYKTNKFYVGLSLGHIPRTKYTFGLDSVSSRISNHLYLTGGYDFRLGPSLVLTPTALVQTDMNEFTYLFGAMGTYNDRFWVGLQARQSIASRDAQKGGKTLANDDIILLVGMSMLKNNALRIGYAFDFVTSGVAAKQRTSQEIMLSYFIPAPWDAPKPKVRTPRYRHDEN